MKPIDDVKRLLASCTREQRREVFDALRSEFPVHSIEDRLGISAELILEAFDRAGEFTYRMMRGVIAEAAFARFVVDELDGWREVPTEGDPPYDFLLEDETGPVRVQVKLQRSKGGTPLTAGRQRVLKPFPPDSFVVETQKSRKGEKGGESTREYRYGAFDVLAVCLQPATGDWSRFRYAPASLLLSDEWARKQGATSSGDPSRIYKFQPVLMESNAVWSDRFEDVVSLARDLDRGSPSTSGLGRVTEPPDLFGSA